MILNEKEIRKIYFSLFMLFITLINNLNSQFVMEKFNQDNEIQIELSDEIAQGIYSNLAVISHSTSEFVIDLFALYQECPRQKSNQELS